MGERQVDRNAAIYADKQAGMTYVSLSEKYNLSAASITRVCKREAESDEVAEETELYKLYSDDMRVFGALFRHGARTAKDVIILGDHVPRLSWKQLILVKDKARKHLVSGGVLE
jgi:hypothetical protein